MDQPGKVANPARSWSAEQGKLYFPCPRSRLRVWSRETSSAVLSRVSLVILYIQTESGACLLTRFLAISAATSVYLYRYSPYAIGSVPSLSGHANAYRWRSLPRVLRHRASSPQGSSERVLPLHHHGPINVRLSFPTPTIGMKWAY